MSRSLCVAAALLMLLGVAQARYSGDGTAYSGDGEKDKTGFNACEFGGLSGKWEKFYAALPVGQFDRDSHCGQCVEVCGGAGCIKVKVVDSCASCSHGDIDLSTDALDACTGYNWDRKPVTWSFCDCDGGSSERSSEDSPSKKSRKGKSGRKQRGGDKKGKKGGKKQRKEDN